MNLKFEFEFVSLCMHKDIMVLAMFERDGIEREKEIERDRFTYFDLL